MSVACPLPVPSSCISSSSSASSPSSISLLHQNQSSLKRSHCSQLQLPIPKRACSSRRLSIAQLVHEDVDNNNPRALPSPLVNFPLLSEEKTYPSESSPPTSPSPSPMFERHSSVSLSSPSSNSQSHSHSPSPPQSACFIHVPTPHDTTMTATTTTTTTTTTTSTATGHVHHDQQATAQEEQEYQRLHENQEQEQHQDKHNDSSTLPDKFTKSRAVGQSHRDNERGHIHALTKAVVKGQQENFLLLSLFLRHPRNICTTRDLENIVDSESNGMYVGQQQGGLEAFDYGDDVIQTDDDQRDFDLRMIRSSLNGDMTEDADVFADDVATAHGLYELSAESARRLGQRFISAELAAALLEFIACRRNLVAPQHDPKDPARPRRRRTSYRSATSQQQAESIVMYCIELLSKRYGMSRGLIGRHRRLYNDVTKNGNMTWNDDMIDFIDGKLGALGRLLRCFDVMESLFNPSNWSDIYNGEGVGMDGERDGDGEGGRVRDSPPESPTRPDAAEFGSPNRRRGEGAKRCSRCHKLKVSGSGHGRSKCDDGHSISSSVPYPAPTQPDPDHY